MDCYDDILPMFARKKFEQQSDKWMAKKKYSKTLVKPAQFEGLINVTAGIAVISMASPMLHEVPGLLLVGPFCNLFVRPVAERLT